MEKLISIDLKADFGFLRKPDVNDGISMSYNMLHKPCILGVFGAILGLNGYQKRGELPDYYLQLQDLKIGIAPLNDQNGNFTKTTITYTNTVGYANKDGNFIAYENTLIKPSYRIYVVVKSNSDLDQNLKNYRAEFLPYLGKNEFPIWWENYQEFELIPFNQDFDFNVKSIFIKEDIITDKESKESGSGFLGWLESLKTSLFYFERLPIGFQEYDTKRGKEYQYKLLPFAYTNATFSKDWNLENLYKIGNEDVVQLN